MQKNYNENLVAGAAIRDDKGRRISKLFEASHPKMTVGYAKNLIMPDDPTEQEFNFRQSGGGVIEDGVAVIDKAKGNSVVWNQLIKDFREPSNWLTGGNDVTIVGDKIHIKFASASSLNAFGVKSSAFFAGHKYYIQMNNENAVPLAAVKLGSENSVGSNGSTMGGPELPLITAAIPTGSAGDGAVWFWASDETKLEGDFSNIYAIDLTQMFGAGNEPTTYEEFLQRKPKVADEYAYNEGTIVNNKVEKVVTTGRNLWDEEWEVGAITSSAGANIQSDKDIRSKNYIPVMPGTTYYCKCPQNSLNVRYYDANKNFLEAFNTTIVNAFTVPSGAHYLRFWGLGTTYNHDICINLSDASFNGQYAPYEKHELDLSWVKDIKDSEGVKLFEDGMKSAGTAFDEVGKNKAVKRLGSVDLGTLSWDTSWWDGDGRIYASLDNKKAGATNIVYPLGLTHRYDGDLKNTIGICGNGVNNYIYVGDAKTHSSASEFISSLSGVYAYYELAEPIEVEYDEKNLTYPVIAGGTEEAIASEPSSAFRADIGYGIDAVKTILDLKARVEALEGK